MNTQSDNIQARTLVWLVTALIALIVLASATLYWWVDLPARTLDWFTSMSVTPALQVNPGSDLKRFKQQQAAQLQSFGWVDREHSFAHIPIDEAMRLLPQRQPYLVIEPTGATAKDEP